MKDITKKVKIISRPFVLKGTSLTICFEHGVFLGKQIDYVLIPWDHTEDERVRKLTTGDYIYVTLGEYGNTFRGIA